MKNYHIELNSHRDDNSVEVVLIKPEGATLLARFPYNTPTSRRAAAHVAITYADNMDAEIRPNGHSTTFHLNCAAQERNFETEKV